MTDTMSLEEYREYNRTGKLPKRFEKQTRSSVLATIADTAPDVLDHAANAGKKHKYGAKPRDGFDSTAEFDRYGELKLMEKAGLIVNLELQPRFDLHVQGVKIGAYVADFRYVDVQTDQVVVEDVKGVKTPMYRWKKRHLEAEYGIHIAEVTA